MRNEVLMIEWEDDQAGFVVYSVEVHVVTDSNTIDNLFHSCNTMSCDVFKCLVPGAEIIEYLDSITDYNEYEHLIYKLIIYEDDDLLLDLGLQEIG